MNPNGQSPRIPPQPRSVTDRPTGTQRPADAGTDGSHASFRESVLTSAARCDSLPATGDP